MIHLGIVTRFDSATGLPYVEVGQLATGYELGPLQMLVGVTLEQGQTVALGEVFPNGGTYVVLGPLAAPPVALFTVTAVHLAATFDATASSAPGSTIASYSWDFGDGSAAGTGATPAHTYTASGTYAVTLTVTNAAGSTSQVTHQLSVAPAPVAAFTDSANALIVAFDGTSSTAPGSSITSYAWNFGDSATGAGAQPSHTYAAAGTYTVTLTITNAAGDTNAVSHTVTVAPAPTAAFTGTPTNLAVAFNGSGSSAPGSTISSYSWDFGDGSGAGSGATPNHTYAAAGTYTVTLTVTNALGGTGSISHTVTVVAAPIAAFTDTPTNLVVAFDGSGSTAPGSTISSYSWDFGDGSAAGSGATPSHTYTAGGTYTVVLTVTNAAGGTGTVSHTVTVTAPVSIAFVAEAHAIGINTTTTVVTIPSTVVAGNALLLILSANESTVNNFTVPAGWTKVDDQATAMESALYKRVAVAGDAGSTVTITVPANTHVNAIILAYSGTNATNPVAAYAKSITGSVSLSSETTPASTVPTAGDFVVSYWACKSSTVTTWTAPGGQTVRSHSDDTGSGRINALATDGGAAAAGACGGLTATTDVAASCLAAWTIVLAGA